jgi:hypothetical protein
MKEIDPRRIRVTKFHRSVPDSSCGVDARQGAITH